MAVNSILSEKDPAAEAVIVGGGMVGMSLAIALDSAGIETAVVDPAPADEVTQPAFDGRASALAHCAVRMYRALGIWPYLAEHAQPIWEIRVSDGDAPLFLHFDHAELGEEPFGYMLENRHIRRALLKRLEGCERVTHLRPARAVGLERDACGARVGLADGRTCRGLAVLAADGRTSAMRQAAGIRSFGWSYPQTGIVATVAHERPHHGIAHERFLPAGPFAILPLLGNRSSLVWTERSPRAGAMLTLDAPAFAAEIQERFGDFLGAVAPEGPRWSYPLALHYAERYVDRRLALLGDAAHGIHPIAGQGLNLGLKDVAALAEVLVAARRLGLDFGDASVLARYERWRRLDNTTLAVVTDGLNRLFSNEFGPLKAARDVGLAAVNRLGPAKRFLMRHARGTVGKLPRLLRGETL